MIAPLLPLYPFFSHGTRENMCSATAASLVQGACIECSLLGSASSCGESAANDSPLPLEVAAVVWLPSLQKALQRLVSAPSIAGAEGWQLGWPLAHHPQHAQQQQQQQQQQRLDLPHLCSHLVVLQPKGIASSSATSSNLGGSGSGNGYESSSLRGALRALQRCSFPAAAAAAVSGTAPPQPGSWIMAVGCPFGALLPSHLTGYVTTGVLASVLHGGGEAGGDSSANLGPDLLLADMRSLPGMEGGPVFDSAGRLFGVLLPALRQVLIAVQAEQP